MSRRSCHLAGAITALALTLPTFASSHREAPFITEIPKVDATDFYLFRSYEAGRADSVILIANYLPLQDPYGGPNYFTLDPDARYGIKIDNDGDGLEDITFEFRFRIELNDISVPAGDVQTSIPLIAAGQLAVGNSTALNVVESYGLGVRFGPAGAVQPITNAITGSPRFVKPLDNVGTKTIPDYDAYAAQYVYPIALPGSNLSGRLFVGQRKDPFVVNLGETFDLVNLNPLGPVVGQHDSLDDKNVTSLILEIPIEYLTSMGEPVIGGWTTASLPRVRTLLDEPTFQKPEVSSADFVQVSRLGSPLVNEVVIGLKDKNKFNGSNPVDDGQFLQYVTNPSLPVLLNALFGVAPPCTPRNDLVLAFLTGVPGLNQPANVVPSEMLRLNTTIPAVPRGQQVSTGVIGGDVAGFPNGRRPGDDVVDIALRVVMGRLLDAACAPDGQLPYTDGAFINDSFFGDQFPFLKTPIPGSPDPDDFGG